MNKADKLNAAAKRKPAPAATQVKKPSQDQIEQFASGKKKPVENAKVTLHFDFDLDQRLRTYWAGQRAPRGTLSDLVQAMVIEGLDLRKG